MSQTLADYYRNCASLGVALTPYEKRIVAAHPPTPALPRLPAHLLREIAQAAGIATTHNPETNQ
jgi:hypothetical protein